VIHLLFGLMVFVPFFEIFYHQGIFRKLSYLLAFLFITSVGAWYELLEWITMILFCKQAEEVCFEAITQGDIWDAQKDMAYAILGSMIALLFHGFLGSKTSYAALRPRR
jgi:putative membrane protein